MNGSLESVTKAADSALKEIPDDLRYSLTNAQGKEAYPISGTVWAVVYVNQPAGKKEALVDFLTWITHDGQKYCEELHYAKLPPGLVERLDKKIAQIKVKEGTSGGAVDRLNGTGSTFVEPLMKKWAAEYHKAKNVEVNYQGKGSGAGIEGMISGTADFGCTDAPMTDKQLADAMAKGGEVVHIPLAMGAVVPIYNLKK
jgi:ABC-type phosphate transport system substrate-binding protein